MFKRFAIAGPMQVLESNPWALNALTNFSYTTPNAVTVTSDLSNYLPITVTGESNDDLKKIQADFQRFGLKELWKRIVCTTFEKPDLIEIPLTFDTDNFLYFRCRAISGGEKHGSNNNGDFFPWRELQASYKTFIGKGLYVEHDSNSPDKAKGIILNAELNEAEQFVECIIAVDKNEVYRTKSGEIRNVAADIRSGRLDATSMGTLCTRAECSVCHNIATNAGNLCNCMNPQSPLYCKGRKDSQGNIIYEKNYGLCFTEESCVHLPADPKADIYTRTVIGSQQDIKNSNTEEEDMESELKGIMAKISAADFATLKRALAKDVEDKEDKKEEKEEKEDKPKAPKKEKVEEPTSLSEDTKEMVEKTIERKVDQAIKQQVSDMIDQKLSPILEQIPGIIAPTVEKEVDLEAPVVKEKVDELRNEQPGGAVPMPLVKDVPTAPAGKPTEVALPQAASKRKADADGIVKDVPTALETLEIALGDGFILKPEKVTDKEMLRLYDRDNATGLYVEPLVGELAEAEKIAQYRTLLRLEEGKGLMEEPINIEPMEEVEMETIEPMEIGSSLRRQKSNSRGGDSMKLGYLAGESFDKSFLIAEEGDKRRVVRASLIMPADIQSMELKDPKNVITPQECMASISAECKDLAGFDSWVKKEVASLKTRASLKREAVGVTEGQQPPTFARNEGEVVKPEGVKSGVHAEAGVDWATNPKETADSRRTDINRGEGGGKVPAFYNRLPKTQVETVEDARNLQSSLKKENADLKAQVATLNKKAKEADVQEVMQKISTIIEPAEKQKWLDRLVNASEGELALISDVLDKTEKRKAEAAAVEQVEGEAVPQIFASENPSAQESLVSTWLQLDEMKAEREHPQSI